MATKNTFTGQFMYYENINGKEKKIMKTFTDADKFATFTKKYPMPTLGSLVGLVSPIKKPLASKKPLKTAKSIKGKSAKKK